MGMLRWWLLWWEIYIVDWINFVGYGYRKIDFELESGLRSGRGRLRLKFEEEKGMKEKDMW